MSPQTIWKHLRMILFWSEIFKNDIVLELKNVIANNMKTFKNDICLELKNVAKREVLEMIC